MRTKLISVLIIVISFNCFAQKNKQDTLQNSLYKGSWSLMFEVGNNFTLKSFEGLMLSLKTHFSPKLALRFGFNLSESVNNSTLDYKDYYYGYAGTGVPINNNSISYNFLITPVYYFNPQSKVNIFIGLGPVASYSHYYSEHYYVDYYLNYQHIDSWGVGLEGIIGIEIFPLHYLSLFGEYSASATIGKTINKDATKDYHTNVIQEFYNTSSSFSRISANIVRLGISIYF